MLTLALVLLGLQLVGIVVVTVIFWRIHRLANEIIATCDRITSSLKGSGP